MQYLPITVVIIIFYVVNTRALGNHVCSKLSAVRISNSARVSYNLTPNRNESESTLYFSSSIAWSFGIIVVKAMKDLQMTVNLPARENVVRTVSVWLQISVNVFEAIEIQPKMVTVRQFAPLIAGCTSTVRHRKHANVWRTLSGALIVMAFVYQFVRPAVVPINSARNRPISANACRVTALAWSRASVIRSVGRSVDRTAVA